ncbi:hypothetical protein HAX54_010064, partial [Datura stramonium]|nr:hypothetical protein [Datura stramonium]
AKTTTTRVVGTINKTHSHQNQLVKLAKILPTLYKKSVKTAMKDIFDSLNKLCSRVNVIEGLVSSLNADMRELKGRTSRSDPNMSFLDEAMAALRTTWGPIDD